MKTSTGPTFMNTDVLFVDPDGSTGLFKVLCHTRVPRPDRVDWECRRVLCRVCTRSGGGILELLCSDCNQITLVTLSTGTL